MTVKSSNKQTILKESLKGTLMLCYEIKNGRKYSESVFILCTTYFCPTYLVFFLTDRLLMQNEHLILVLETSALIWACAWGIRGGSLPIMLEWQEHCSSVRPQGVEKNNISTLYMINVFPHRVMVTVFWSKSVLLVGRENYLSSLLVSTYILVSKASQHFIRFKIIISQLH